jgi:hypothetical protein
LPHPIRHRLKPHSTVARGGLVVALCATGVRDQNLALDRPPMLTNGAAPS